MELSIRLRHDIDRLNRMIHNDSPGTSPMKSETEPQEVYDLKVTFTIRSFDSCCSFNCFDLKTPEV